VENWWENNVISSTETGKLAAVFVFGRM